MQRSIDELNHSAPDIPESPEKERGALSALFEKAFFATRNAVERVLEPLSKKLPHPNIITGPIRVGFAISGVTLHTYNQLLGTVLYGLNVVGDALDGISSRANDGKRVTKEGEKFDPLVDKVTNAIALVNLSVQKLMIMGTPDISDGTFIAAAATNIAVDVYSQVQRGPIGEQAKDAYQAMFHPHSCTPVEPSTKKRANSANHWGKMKYAGQNIAILGSMAASGSEEMQIAATVVLSISAVLGIIGTKLRKTIQ